MRNLMSAKRQIISSGCPAAFHFSICAAADVLLYFNFGLSRLAYGCFQANSGILVYQEEKSLLLIFILCLIILAIKLLS
jgi:hypothetical protein